MSEKPSIAGSTVSGKIFIYRFDKSEDDTSSLNWLNFNKRIDYLSTCFLEGKDDRECLIIASKNTISAYGIFSLTKRSIRKQRFILPGYHRWNNLYKLRYLRSCTRTSGFCRRKLFYPGLHNGGRGEILEYDKR